MTPQEIAEAAAASMYARDHAAQALGMTIARIAPEEARLEMVVRRDMLNGHGTCHGGLIFTLADTAFGYACNSSNKVSVALGCDISFVAPAREGERLVATARRRTGEGRTGVFDVEVAEASGRLVALFRGTSYGVKGAVAPGLGDAG